ncbi:uncharacterized protein BX663DRAFT_496650, partial [Cokeromyces recurvatus]|uniref:uncharacterized protein n=1 Tax=Cokeromyces recurvatus TaxID=90255 RepID=UPI00221E6C89
MLLLFVYPCSPLSHCSSFYSYYLIIKLLLFYDIKNLSFFFFLEYFDLWWLITI